jgi:hypothetical protein
MVHPSQPYQRCDRAVFIGIPLVFLQYSLINLIMRLFDPTLKS